MKPNFYKRRKRNVHNCLDLLVELSSVSMYIATSAVGLESGPLGETKCNNVDRCASKQLISVYSNQMDTELLSRNSYSDMSKD